MLTHHQSKDQAVRYCLEVQALNYTGSPQYFEVDWDDWGNGQTALEDHLHVREVQQLST